MLKIKMEFRDKVGALRDIRIKITILELSVDSGEA